MTSSQFTYNQPSSAPSPVVREEHIEYGFIGKLQGLKYEYRADIRDRASLDRNFREKFEALNRVHLAIGDIVGQPMLTHKAVHEAHVTAEVIAGELQGNKELASTAFNARVIPSMAAAPTCRQAENKSGVKSGSCAHGTGARCC